MSWQPSKRKNRYKLLEYSSANGPSFAKKQLGYVHILGDGGITHPAENVPATVSVRRASQPPLTPDRSGSGGAPQMKNTFILWSSALSFRLVPSVVRWKITAKLVKTATRDTQNVYDKQLRSFTYHGGIKCGSYIVTLGIFSQSTIRCRKFSSNDLNSVLR
ncbi:hypothetical protein WA026_003639 [Henosepilachna vigintioctopunctata]|uniref:Uncharacterized protein n=1 Tax=Henosepilachna vigintioctopunctata TaxID=420089 RepID=A0AAW1U566_9CUCU